MDAQSLIEAFCRRGIRLIPNPPKLTVEPPSKLTDSDRAALRAHKPELLAHFRAEQDRAEALALLNRLKTYTLPAGRMPAARAIVERLKPLLAAPEIDPAQALTTLQQIERELVALGGASDPELTEAATIVERAFPGARLVDVRKLQ